MYIYYLLMVEKPNSVTCAKPPTYHNAWATFSHVWSRIRTHDPRQL